ncbi:MAG: hypothetical protein ACLFVN_12895 [Phycisphaeraceae bacterium]
MSDTQRPQPQHPRYSDDDLLAKAIPIDHGDEEEPSIEASGEDLAPIEFDETPASSSRSGTSKIRTFGPDAHAERDWKRQPQGNGKGAVRVKTFVAKLRLDAIDHLDEQINEFLEQHPDCEVKFATTTVGSLVGKLTEEAIFVNIWM